MFKELIKYRDLLYMLVLRDIRIRYKQAVMGFIWAIFMPIIAIASGILVKAAMSIYAGKSLDLTGIISVSVKVLPWSFFMSAVRFSVQSLIGNGELITKIYFPREVLTIAPIIACLFDFSIAAVTLIIFLSAVKVGFSIYLLWVPLILLALILFTAGMGLMLAAANLFYRDIKYVVEIILMFGIFYTPVFYETKIFGRWGVLLMINPINSILETLSNIIVVHNKPDLLWVAYIILSSLMVFMIGVHIFHKKEPYFAESI